MTDTTQIEDGAAEKGAQPGATASSAGLQQLTNDELRQVIKEGEKILAAREEVAKKEAARQIKEIAEAHGLKVTIEGAGRKRGRPRKSEAGTDKTG